MPQKNPHTFSSTYFLRKCKYLEDGLTKCQDFLHRGVFGSRESEFAKRFAKSAYARGFAHLAHKGYKL